MKKKILVLGMVIIMTAVSLAGCGAPTEPAGENDSQDTDSSLDKGMKIAILTCGGNIDDGSFNQNNYEGIQDFIEENPMAEVTALREDTGDTTACANMVADIVGDYDVIICCGFNYVAIGDVALENPDVNFILVDASAVDSQGEDVEAENLYSMLFKEQESGFFAGIAAALETKSNKVAVVDAIAYPSNVNYQYGFMAGVYYANKEYGTSAEVVEIPSYAGMDINNENVGGNYTGSFSDEATGKVVGKALIDEGCDIIFVAAGNSGNGVFTAIKEAKGVYGIGVDVDQYDDGANGNSNIILTSVLKNMRVNITRQLNAVKDGSFKGENALLDASTDSTGFISESGRCQLSESTIEKLDEAYEKVKSGEIIPPGFGTEAVPDDFR